jgi:hypothetical protein
MIDATNAVKTAAIRGRATICHLILDAINKGTIEPIQKFHLQRKENNKTKCIKAAFTSPCLNKAAQCVATVIANEPPTQMPILRGLVQETTTKLTSAMERHLQSLKDQLKAVQSGKNPPQKVKGNGTKKTPTGILKNKDTPAATKKKSAQSVIAPDLGVNNSATAHAKGKKKSRVQKVSFNWKKATKPTKIVLVTNQARREPCENFGFIPNLVISTHLNARHLLGETPTGVYFAHFTNKQFHDHTTKKIIPAAPSTVLGFGLKFIPAPKKSIGQDDVNKAIKQCGGFFT